MAEGLRHEGNPLPDGRKVEGLLDSIEFELHSHSYMRPPQGDDCPCWCGENAPSMPAHQAQKIMELIEETEL